MFQVTVNGAQKEVSGNRTILDSLKEIGVSIPTLCNDPRIHAYGGCRLCLVRIKGEARLLPACDTVIKEGMDIETHSPEIEELRKELLLLMANNYPAFDSDKTEAALVDKEFQKLLNEYGIKPKSETIQPKEKLAIDLSHPYIAVDMSRCITCFRCVRICNEVQGQFVWKALNRGDTTKIVPDFGTTLIESSCVSCGACADTCPSGALLDKTILERGIPDRWVKTTCPYCGVGCEMWVGAKNDRIVATRPALESPVNKGHLCVKGRYAFDYLDHEDRITEPMIRMNGSWKKVSWDEALTFTTDKLSAIMKTHGKDSVGMLGSSRATNEENYLAQKFARAVLKTNNVDCCARVCHTPSAAALKFMLGTGASTNSFDDIERSKTILVSGSNATENHPIVGARIKQHVIRGANLIVIDPRKTELARYAMIHLAPRPGTNIPLLSAIANVIITERLYDEDFIASRIDDHEEYFKFIQQWTPERASAITGVTENDIRRSARLYASEKPSMCFHGLGMTEHTQGTEGVMSLVNLALLTGNLGKPGTGINPLRGQNNVQGSAHMGCDPSILTGSAPIKDVRESFEKIWKTNIPVEKGLNLLEMIDAASAGKFKALWVTGYDVFLSNAHASSTRSAFEAMDLVVIQDLFLNETAREFGTVFLPCCSNYEKDGTFMNAERRISRVRKVVEPRGNSKTDSEILQLAARYMARHTGIANLLPMESAEQTWNEVRKVWPGAGGISYSRIESAGIQWPCPDVNHPGTQILHTEKFSHALRTSFKQIEYRPTEENTSPDYPFLMITGRSLYQFNAGTMTLRTPNVILRPTDYLDICMYDAQRLNLMLESKARIISKYGEAILPVRIDDGIKPGECFATFHMPEIFLNNVTSSHRDNLVKTPEYKVTAVRIEKL